MSKRRRRTTSPTPSSSTAPAQQRSSRLEAIRRDKAVYDELMHRVESEDLAIPKARIAGVPKARLRSVLAGAGAEGSRLALEAPPPPGVPDVGPDVAPIAEAIVLLHGRPSLLVQNGTFEVPDSDVWKARLYPYKSKLERLIRSVGRIELLNHPDYAWVGTGWVIGDGMIITNRHVARTFAERGAAGAFIFQTSLDGATVTPRIDFREEYKQTLPAQELAIESVLHIENDGNQHPDLAVVRVSKSTARRLPPPIVLADGALDENGFLAVIGYPAWDTRNAADAMRDVFGEIYDVKRLAPGKVATMPAGRWYFTHDCSTLGGNSGSVVVDIDAGRAVGLHFGGAFRQANYAVTTPTIKQILSRLKVSVAAPKPDERAGGDGAAPEEAPPRKVEDYDDRFGYEDDFLGPAAEHRVPLPRLPAGADAADVKGAPAGARKVLRYTHFSLALSKSRRLPIYTAVNIDGEQLRNIPRKGDAWYFDPRVGKDFQAGNDIYARNDLDRGHMVRRLDPVWGSTSEAKRANDDTFHFANACPQHKDLNQRTWNDLEDYILGNSGAHELKVCLFTGPVLEDDDPAYRGIQLPRQFWKVAVLVDSASGKLSTTAYMLSQASMIKDITEFVFGQYRTYQVPVARVEKLTGLRFGNVANFDPLKGQPIDEALAVGARSSRVIEGPRDIEF